MSWGAQYKPSVSGPLPPAPPQFDDAQWWPSEAGVASGTAAEGGITSGTTAGPSFADAAWDDDEDEGEGVLIRDDGGGVVTPMAAVTGLGPAPRVANPNPNPNPNLTLTQVGVEAKKLHDDALALIDEV